MGEIDSTDDNDYEADSGVEPELGTELEDDSEEKRGKITC